MIPLPPRDPALSALDVVLNGSAVGEILEQYLPECASGALRVESCRPLRVRYKPGMNCHVRYDLLLHDSGANSEIKTLAQIELLAGNRAERLWADLALSQLVKRAARCYPDPPVDRAAYIPEMQAIVQLYPVDIKLPALISATSSSEMHWAIRKVLPENRGLALREGYAELIRYKPAKRAVLRYRLGDAGVDTVYGKLHHDARGAVLFQISRVLREAGVNTPAPLAYLRDLRMLVLAEGRGSRLGDLRGSSEFEAWMGPVAEALAHLHTVRTDALPIRSSQNGAGGVLDTGRMIGALMPNLALDATRLATAIATELAAAQVPAVTVHGDFCVPQVLISDAGVVLLDFDKIQVGNPLLDVASFLASLSECQDDPCRIADSPRTAFLDAYLTLRPETQEHLLPLFESAKLFKAAVGPFRRLKPDWPGDSERLMGLAAQRLGEYRRRCGSLSSARPIL